MSDEIENKVESMMRAEVHAGGVVEPGGIVTTGDGADSPEIVFVPHEGKTLVYSRENWDHLNDRPMPPAPEPLTSEQIRTIVAETIHKVLYPESGGLVTHQHRRVRMWDEQGDEWCGVLYKKEKESEM